MLRLSSVSQTLCAERTWPARVSESAVAVNQRALRRRPHERLKFVLA